MVFGVGVLFGGLAVNSYHRAKNAEREAELDESWEQANSYARKYWDAYNDLEERYNSPEEGTVVITGDGRLNILNTPEEEERIRRGAEIMEKYSKSCEERATPEEREMWHKNIWDTWYEMHPEECPKEETNETKPTEEAEDNMNWTDEDLVFSEIPDEWKNRKGYHVIDPNKVEEDDAMRCEGYYSWHDCLYYRPDRILFSELDNDILNETDGCSDEAKKEYLDVDTYLGQFDGQQENFILLRNDYKRVIMNIEVLEEDFCMPIEEYTEDTDDDFGNRVTVTKLTVH